MNGNSFEVTMFRQFLELLLPIFVITLRKIVCLALCLQPPVFGPGQETRQTQGGLAEQNKCLFFTDLGEILVPFCDFTKGWFQETLAGIFWEVRSQVRDRFCIILDFCFLTHCDISHNTQKKDLAWKNVWIFFFYTMCSCGSKTFQVEFYPEQISTNDITEEPQHHNRNHIRACHWNTSAGEHSSTLTLLGRASCHFHCSRSLSS